MTDNELIARFMGSVCNMVDHTEGNEDYCRDNGLEKWLIPEWTKPEGYNDEWGWGKYSMGKWEYNTSWDWLMPVVEKVFELSKDNFSIGSKVVNHGQLQFNSGSTIEAVYKAVVHFIKWYNNSLI